MVEETPGPANHRQVSEVQSQDLWDRTSKLGVPSKGGYRNLKLWAPGWVDFREDDPENPLVPSFL